MEVLQDKQNELLNRKEIKIVMEAGKNPTIDEATEIVAKEFRADKESIKVKKVMGRFGRNTFLIVANVYKSKEDKEKIEPKIKKGTQEKKKEQEAPAEQPAEESKEEKQEEKQEGTKEGTD